MYRKNIKTKKQKIAWLNLSYGYQYEVDEGVLYGYFSEITTVSIQGVKYTQVTTGWHEKNWSEPARDYARFSQKNWKDSRSKFFGNHFNRKNRRKTKQLIKSGLYDDIPSENHKVYAEKIDWYID